MKYCVFYVCFVSSRRLSLVSPLVLMCDACASQLTVTSDAVILMLWFRCCCRSQVSLPKLEIVVHRPLMTTSKSASDNYELTPQLTTSVDTKDDDAETQASSDTGARCCPFVTDDAITIVQD